MKTPWLGATLLFAMLASPAPAAAQDSYLVVITGVGGDDAHTQQFHAWAGAVIEAATSQGLPAANAIYLSDKPDLDPARIRGRSTRDVVSKTLGELAGRVKPNDEIFILLIGHGSFDGRQASFNLSGPDLSAADYALLLDRFALQRVVFVNTASSSGAFLTALAGPGRVIITATKTGGERNETRFPRYFVEGLEGAAADRDRNGRISMLEAFEFARTRTTASYEQGGHLLTEHAVLDDGAEGKLAATLFLAPQRSRTTEMASADPKLRGLIEERDALERQIAELRLKKDAMDAAAYEAALEKLVTELARRTRSIRELEEKK